MFKLLYMFLTDPLGLPIEPIWEYIILFMVGEIVHEVAFYVSPGGTFGSLIYWSTKIVAFFAIWATLYIVIVIVKFIIAHWIWFAVGGGILLIFIIGLILYNRLDHNRGT